jgi:Fe-S-cluster-containing dehydrogenase component
MPDMIDTVNCCGCRMCVLACSYHHNKTFGLKRGTSIEIRRQPEEGKFGLMLHRVATDEHPRCNCAEGKELCLRYCIEPAYDELKEILRNRAEI